MAGAGGYTPTWTAPKRHSTTSNKKELCRRCGVSPKTAENWVESECAGLRRDKSGRFHTLWLCAWLESRERSRHAPRSRNGGNLESVLLQAKIDLTRGQIQMLRAKLGQLLETMVTADSVAQGIDSIGRITMSNLGRLPKRLAMELECAGLKRSVIETVVEKEIAVIADRIREALASEVHLLRPRASSVWLELGGGEAEEEEGGD